MLSDQGQDDLSAHHLSSNTLRCSSDTPLEGKASLVMQALWLPGATGIQFIDDKPEEDKAAACKPAGLAEEVDGRFQQGTAKLAEHLPCESNFKHNFKVGHCSHFVPVQTGGQPAHAAAISQQNDPPRTPSLDLSAHGLLWDGRCRAEVKVQGKLTLGPILGWGVGKTMHQACYLGRSMAFEQADDPDDDCAPSPLLHETAIMSSS